MNLYRLDASIRQHGSRTRAVADLVEQEWTTGRPEATVTRRDLAADPVPATTWAAAVSTNWTPADGITDEQRAAKALAGREVDALVAADALVFAAPMYNWGVSEHFKTWVDLAVTDPRLPNRGTSALAGKPAVLVTARGGAYGPGTPRDGWDHATGWMRRVLSDVWGLDLRVVEQELTLVGVHPEMDSLKDLADQVRAQAEADAAQHGKEIAARAA